MTSSRIILLLSLIAGAAAAGLGITAFNLTRHERQYRLAEMRGILQSECRTLADRCRNELESFQTQLLPIIESTVPDAKAASRLRLNNPLLREVFIADRRGRLTWPRDGEFARRYEALFDELVSATAKDEKSGREKGKLNGGPMTTRFGMLTDGNRRGWIPWFAGNRFCPLIWTVSRAAPDKIVGAELETIALLSRMPPLFPQTFPQYYRFELVDAQGECICAAGFNPAEGEKTHRLEPTVTIPVADQLAPNWQIRGYLSPTAIPGDGFRLALGLQIVSLLAIVASAGGVSLGLIRREMELARRKTGFVANVSHELKTPLTSIRMYAEMLQEHGDRITPEKRDKYLNVIRAESERLSRLIANVLDFSRLEAGKKRYQPVTVDLPELLTATAEQWRPALVAAGMELQLDLQPTAVTAAIDRDSLVQMLQNLLSNAIKYAASGGLVIIRLESGADGSNEITVADLGPGIPEACRNKLFRKFYRCDDRITAETSGSGLGLAIARRLIRDQSGDLEFHPNPGGGAAFTIKLPGVRS